MRYLIIYESGVFFKTDNLTDDEINTSPEFVDIIDTKNMTSLSNDLSWEPIQEWE